MIGFVSLVGFVDRKMENNARVIPLRWLKMVRYSGHFSSLSLEVVVFWKVVVRAWFNGRNIGCNGWIDCYLTWKRRTPSTCEHSLSCLEEKKERSRQRESGKRWWTKRDTAAAAEDPFNLHEWGSALKLPSFTDYNWKCSVEWMCPSGCFPRQYG